MEADEQGYTYILFYDKLKCHSDRFHAYAHSLESRSMVNERKYWNSIGGFKRQAIRERRRNEMQFINQLQKIGF